MKYANKIGAQYVVVLGEDEVASGSARLKRMADGAEIEISLNALEQGGLAAVAAGFEKEEA